MKRTPISFNAEMIKALPVKRLRIVAKPGMEEDPEHLSMRLVNGFIVEDSSGCWLWNRFKNNQGYGTLTIRGRQQYAHRLAFSLWVGEIPFGYVVMHKCDTPACINPEHLTTGTRSDNMKDCYNKGRSRIPSPRMIGESNGCAKLNKTQVIEIHKLANEGGNQRIIAELHGITQTTVSLIKRGKIWKHILDFKATA